MLSPAGQRGDGAVVVDECQLAVVHRPDVRACNSDEHRVDVPVCERFQVQHEAVLGAGRL